MDPKVHYRVHKGASTDPSPEQDVSSPRSENLFLISFRVHQPKSDFLLLQVYAPKIHAKASGNIVYPSNHDLTGARPV
jgi:hypothetical protein